MKYLLLVDIKNSRHYPIKILWKKLNKLCDQINKDYKLSAPMLITLGDEFQMVCKNKTQAISVLAAIKKELHPIEFRAVATAYYKKTDKFNTLNKFNKVMQKSNSNPLISQKFIKAHRLLEQKKDEIIFI